MGALRILGAAVLLAGVVGSVLYVVWLLDYVYGLGGMISRGVNTPPLLYFAAWGLVWGPLLFLSGMGLLAVASEETPDSV